MKTYRELQEKTNPLVENVKKLNNKWLSDIEKHAAKIFTSAVTPKEEKQFDKMQGSINSIMRDMEEFFAKFVG